MEKHDKFAKTLGTCLAIILIAATRFWTDLNIKQTMSGGVPFYSIFTRIIPFLAIFFFVFYKDIKRKAIAIRTLFFDPFYAIILLYLLVSSYSALMISAYPFSVWKAFELGVVLYIGATLRSLNLSERGKYDTMHAFFKALLFLEILILFSAILDPTEGFRNGQIRGIFPPLNPNSVGFWTLTSLLYAYFMLYEKKMNQNFWLALLFFMLLAAKSRTSFVAIIFLIGLMVVRIVFRLIFFNRIKYKFVIGLVISIVIGTAGLVVMGPMIQTWVTKGQSTEELSNMSHRIFTWQAAVLAIRKNPTIGYGIMAKSRQLAFEYADVMNYHTNRGIAHVHNSALESLLAAGFIGGGLYILMFYLLGIRCLFAFAIAKLRNNLTPLNAFATATIVVFIFRSFTGPCFAFLCLEYMLIVTFHSVRAYPWQDTVKKKVRKKATLAAA